MTDSQAGSAAYCTSCGAPLTSNHYCLAGDADADVGATIQAERHMTGLGYASSPVGMHVSSTPAETAATRDTPRSPVSWVLVVVAAIAGAAVVTAIFVLVGRLGSSSGSPQENPAAVQQSPTMPEVAPSEAPTSTLGAELTPRAAKDTVTAVYAAWSDRRMPELRGLTTPDTWPEFPKSLLDDKGIESVTTTVDSVTASGAGYEACGVQTFTKWGGSTQVEARCWTISPGADGPVVSGSYGWRLIQEWD